MGLIALINHLANFAAPALVLGLLAVLGGRLLGAKDARKPGWLAQTAINFVAGVLALSAAALLWGADGKMAGYGLLVVTVATSQWLLLRGWRR